MEYKFDKWHDDPKDSQVIVAITGTSEYIAMRLLELHNQCIVKYGKPIQGKVWSSGGESEVITPIWKSRKY